LDAFSCASARLLLSRCVAGSRVVTELLVVVGLEVEASPTALLRCSRPRCARQACCARGGCRARGGVLLGALLLLLLLLLPTLPRLLLRSARSWAASIAAAAGLGLLLVVPSACVGGAR